MHTASVLSLALGRLELGIVGVLEAAAGAAGEGLACETYSQDQK